ncbi:MAG: hypothetical protein OXG25_05960 [Gammaproteobacteria bacterium]|nr:hypothetical protein [Gammaproteobacteria bacterium]
MRALRTLVAVFLGVLLCGCTLKPTLRYVDLAPPLTATKSIPEHLLLNVGVKVLDANVPKSYDERTALNITDEIRRAESNYIAHFAKELLQSTGNWGAVRVLPRDSYAVDLTISGTILHSDGERLIVHIRVQDARGVVWLDDEYETLASKFAYDPQIPENVDPFQTMYKSVADQMYEFHAQLTNDEIQEIRTTAELLFAKEFSPDAFDEHLTVEEDEVVRISRMPSEEDPMLRRVRQIREREYLFIDTLDEYYGDFATRMYPSYQKWREGSYEDAIAYREERNKARAKMLAGGLMIASGAAMQRSSTRATEYAGFAGVIGGAGEVLGAIQARANLTLHGAALRELGVSAAADISPHTLELENATISLMGSVDEQYTELKRILRRLFFEDYQLPIPEDVADTQIDEGLSAEILKIPDPRD